jgi:hypothetical protein
LAAAAAGKPMANNPLAPLLRRMSEQFIDDGDLSTRLQSLFKVPCLCDQTVLSISRQAALCRLTSPFGKWVGVGWRAGDGHGPVRHAELSRVHHGDEEAGESSALI